MCVSDWRLARFVTTQGTNFDLNPSLTRTFVANRQRVGVAVSINPLFSMATGSLKITFTNGAKFGVNFYNPDKEILMPVYGNLPTLGFSIVGIEDTGITGTVTEFFLTEEILAASLKAFNSEYATALRI